MKHVSGVEEVCITGVLIWQLGSILNIPLDDVPPGDSPRMDRNDENDPQNPQPQKENSVCGSFYQMNQFLLPYCNL